MGVGAGTTTWRRSRLCGFSRTVRQKRCRAKTSACASISARFKPPFASTPLATAITTTYGRHCFKIKSRTAWNGFKQQTTLGMSTRTVRCFSAAISLSLSLPLSLALSVCVLIKLTAVGFMKINCALCSIITVDLLGLAEAL